MAVPEWLPVGTGWRECALINDISIRLLGPVELRIGGKPVDGLSPQGRAVLARLALASGQTMTVEQLIDTLWPDDPPATARKSIQKRVSEIRSHSDEGLVESEPSGYRLAIDPGQIDTVRFERLATSQEAGTLAAALELWGGDPLSGVSGDFGAWRTRFSEMHTDAMERHATLRLERGESATAVAELEELVARYPLREALWGLLMRALYQSGRQAEALRAYQRFSRLLGEELGIEPSDELQGLEQQMLLQDPALAGERTALRTTSGNLPVRLTSFVGRTAELAAVSELLGSSRLVTLVGPGGAGKTRLAVETAAFIQNRFPDGAWFVDLAPLTEGDQVAAAVVETLALSGRPSQPATEVLAEYLTDRTALVVMDNCEHVVEAAASLLDVLLGRAPAMRILATSREPLGSRGEHMYDVEPLEVPGLEDSDVVAFDSVRLFVDRASAVDRHFAIGTDNAPAVAEICRKLDGMPLAIELAAARVRTFDASHLAGLLDDRFSILVSPVRNAATRHQTLRATVEWSHDLLPEPHRVLFRRLSIFRGGCYLDAIEGVCCFDPISEADVLMLLPELVDKSLANADRSSLRPTRYRLLETLRQFGDELLDADQTAELQARHARHYLAAAEEHRPQLRGAHQARAVQLLRADYDNFREALRWGFEHDAALAVRLAVALADYWDVAGPRITEAQMWMERAVAVVDRVDPELRLACLIAASDLFVSTTLERSESYALAALDESRALGDRAAEAQALRALAWARGLAEHVPEATEYGRQAYEIFRDLDDPWELALSLERLGQTNFERPKEALGYLAESLELYRSVGEKRRAAMVLYKMAERAMQARENLDEARGWALEAVSILEDLGSEQHTAHALLELGKVTRRQGDPEGAVEVLDRALGLFRKVGDKRCTVRTLSALGTALAEAEQADRAYSILEEAIERGRELGERQVLRVTVAALGRLVADAGRAEDATVLLGVAEQLASELRISVAPALEDRRTKRLSELRRQLGDDRYEAAWARGSAMSAREAADFASRLIATVGPKPG